MGLFSLAYKYALNFLNLEQKVVKYGLILACLPIHRAKLCIFRKFCLLEVFSMKIFTAENVDAGYGGDLTLWAHLLAREGPRTSYEGHCTEIRRQMP